jgi:fatty-acid desaturase
VIQEFSMYPIVCFVVFVSAYLLNILYITVFYHRGLAHGGVELSAGLRRFVALTGNWVTGLDPKAWVCMHRRHHDFSDTDTDPHSPLNHGVPGVMLAQLRSYERLILKLRAGKPEFTKRVADLDFDVNWLNRYRLWWLPYATHLGIGLTLGLVYGAWLLGLCYFFGIMSHPIQGWMVNALGHSSGGRNFDTDDDSRNNHLVAWLVFGEGFQNNHHRFPSSATFSSRKREVDLGYSLCVAFEKLGLLRIERDLLIHHRLAQAATSDDVPSPPLAS